MATAAVDTIRKELEAKANELVEIESALQRMQEVKNDVAALERTLAILEGREKKGSERPTQQMLQEVLSSLRQPKLHDLAYSVLKEAGKSLSGDEITAAMAARGCKSSKLSILGAIYRAAKTGDRFIANRGVFSLKEWADDLV
jgi:hypothetical protein